MSYVKWLLVQCKIIKQKQLRTTYIVALNRQSSKWAKSANSHSFATFNMMSLLLLQMWLGHLSLCSLSAAQSSEIRACGLTSVYYYIQRLLWCLYSDTLGGRVFHIVGFLLVSWGQLLVPFGRKKLICHMSRRTLHLYVWIHRLVDRNNCGDWAIYNKVGCAEIVLLAASD